MLRRILMLVAVAALMAAMVAASAVTGLAQQEEEGGQYQYQTQEDWGSGPGGPDDGCTDQYGPYNTYYGCDGSIIPSVDA